MDNGLLFRLNTTIVLASKLAYKCQHAIHDMLMLIEPCILGSILHYQTSNRSSKLLSLVSAKTPHYSLSFIRFCFPRPIRSANEISPAFRCSPLTKSPLSPYLDDLARALSSKSRVTFSCSARAANLFSRSRSNLEASCCMAASFRCRSASLSSVGSSRLN